MSNEETFDTYEVKKAIKGFLEFGESSYRCCPQGYFSGGGWAARCLRWHLKQVEKEEKQREEFDYVLVQKPRVGISHSPPFAD